MNTSRIIIGLSALVAVLIVLMVFVSKKRVADYRKLKEEKRQAISAADCKDEVRAYEFGRTMEFYSSMRGLTLERSIEYYKNAHSISYGSYPADNPCVVAGFNDAKNNFESPYNPDGRAWYTLQ